MSEYDLKKRTKLFAVKIIAFVEKLPKTRIAYIIGGQLLRCGASVGSNYRSACRARSMADFISKMGIVEEECDETIYWMEVLVESRQITIESASELLHEANEILSIIVASIKTARTGRPDRVRGRNGVKSCEGTQGIGISGGGKATF